MSDDKTVQPLVTVVIPCFQQQEYLSRALTSLDHQTYHNIEVIVVDDGSELPIVVPNCRSSVQLIRQENLGLSAARNAGLAAAKGEYIKFLDADDELMPPCIELQVSSLGTAKKTICCVAYNEVTEQTGFTKTLFPAFGEAMSALPFINIGPPHIYLYRTDEVKKAGGFSTAERVAGGHEDYDLIFRMVLDGFNLRTVHQVGAIYYKRQGSMSSK
ncbi:glycosyltransferase family A protein, partial [Alteromonas sp. 14N.309.X.WAT.G.H12]|uniref:glycosyltransferase family 2 protein n=1 Tax=Alteromonas sp. 14N.309.X.WAT.G.H12 TaxID=3120824 RepID=UPI002FCF0336